jgi:hypothetical protein
MFGLKVESYFLQHDGRQKDPAISIVLKICVDHDIITGKLGRKELAHSTVRYLSNSFSAESQGTV